MSEFSILATLVKFIEKYYRGRATLAREIVQSSNIFQARTFKFGMDRLHPLLGKSLKEISIGSTLNSLEQVYGGLGA